MGPEQKIDLDELERLEKHLTAPPWLQFCSNYPCVDTGETPQAFRHPESADSYAQLHDRPYTNPFGEWVCAMRNAAPELIRLARIGLKFRRDSSLECPCCGEEAGWGYVFDGDALACGCAGSISTDAETPPYVAGWEECECGRDGFER
jgi:hypothetical protein